MDGVEATTGLQVMAAMMHEDVTAMACSSAASTGTCTWPPCAGTVAYEWMLGGGPMTGVPLVTADSGPAPAAL
jgi:hypothetical protein